MCLRAPPSSSARSPAPACPQDTQPRGIVEVNKCLSIKGAEDAINKPHAFEISTTDQNMYFIADSDKVCACMYAGGLGGGGGWRCGQVGQGDDLRGVIMCYRGGVWSLPTLHLCAALRCAVGEGGLDQRGGAGDRAALQEVSVHRAGHGRGWSKRWRCTMTLGLLGCF